jgi:ParB-like chromosome segregation protein Spo0J
MRVQLSDIKGMERRVRKSQSPEKLEELADSLKEMGGVIVPIKVRANGKGYTLIYGHRRVAAAKMAGFKDIEAIVEDVPEDKLLTQALVENVIREDMAAIDIAKALQSIIDETSCTQEALGKERHPDGVTHQHTLEAKAGTGGDLKLAARVLEKAGKEELSKRETRQVADAVRAAADFGGERAVKTILAKSYADIVATEPAAMPRLQPRPVTLTRHGPTHFEWMKDPRTIAAYEAVRVFDVLIRAIAGGEPRATTSGAEVLKQLRGYLETLIKAIDKATKKVGG